MKRDVLMILEAIGAPVASLQTFADAPAHWRPGRTGALKLGPKVIAYYGEIHPRTVVDDGVAAQDVVRAAIGADKQLITDVNLFDVYRGERMQPGKKSLAIEVTLQPREKTLTDADIEAASAKIVSAVMKATGGTLRG